MAIYNHPMYNRWRNMLARCNNPNNTHYSYYGERGIKVCERWENFENFISDMGIPPTPKHTLDRIDVNGNYEPENVRWATMQEQVIRKRNRRTNTSGYRGVSWSKSMNKWEVNLTYKGKRHIAGHYTNKVAAAKAYDELAVSIHGSEAITNF